MSIYSQETLEVVGLLEDIIIDEMLITQTNVDNDLFEVYRHFIRRLRYEYRWFGIRSKAEFIAKWNDIRNEFVIEDSDFKDSSPSAQMSLLTNITQRMMLVTTPSVWHKNSSLCGHIADVIHVYSQDDTTDENVMYDTQIITTVRRDDIVDILSENKWLVVVILMSWISNRSVLEALGHLTYDDSK